MNTPTKIQHTPAPWHVQPDPQFIGGHPLHQNRFITAGHPDITSEEWQDDPNSVIICSMRDCQNQQANARLIAAAPTLLEACKAALQCQLDVMDENTVDALEKAIAKAQGREA